MTTGNIHVLSTKYCIWK